MFIEKMTAEERETLRKLCNDCKVYQTMEAEAKKAKDDTKEKIRVLLDAYGYEAKETLDIFTIDYRTQEKQIADTDKLKKDGLFEKYSKFQVTKPLTIR